MQTTVKNTKMLPTLESMIAFSKLSLFSLVASAFIKK